MNLIITNRAKKDLAKLDRETAKSVTETLRRFQNDPNLVDLVKLKGFNDKWRIRVGVYRVIMRVEGTFVTVYALRVLHRREAYTIKG